VQKAAAVKTFAGDRQFEKAMRAANTAPKEKFSMEAMESVLYGLAAMFLLCVLGGAGAWVFGRLCGRWEKRP
jgi:ABC-type Fe3+ transport system permease subunit